MLLAHLILLTRPLQHAAKNLSDAGWRQKPITPSQLGRLHRTLEAREAEQAAAAGGGGDSAGAAQGGGSATAAEAGAELTGELERLSCGEASQLISTLHLVGWYEQGLFRFPAMFAG